MARSPLEWRNVGTPDFSPAMQGVQIAANLMARAGESARTAFQDVDKNLARRDQTEYARRLAALQSSEAAAAAMADGSVFAGLNRLTPEDMARAASIRNSLQAFEGEGQNQRIRASGEERASTLFGQSQADRTARQAAAPVLDQIDMLQRQGKFAEADKLRTENASVLGNLEFGDARTARRDIAQGAADFRQGRYQDQAYNIADWNQGRAVENYNDQNTIAKQMVDLVRQGATWEDAEASILNSGINPRAALGALSQARGMFQSVYGDMTGGAASSGGDDKMNVVNYEARGRGFQSVPDNIQTYGQLQQYGRQMVQGTGGKGSSATGPFQITYSTRDEFAPKVLGPNWQSQPRTPESEDRIAEAIFNASKGSAQALRNRWVSLSPAQAERVRQMPWSQAREIIAQGESGATLSPYQASASAVTTVGNQRLGQDRVRPYSQNAGAALNSTASLPEIVNQFAGKDAPYASVGQQRYSQLVTQAMEQSGGRLNPAMAAEVVNQNLQGRSWLDNTWVGPVSRFFSGSGAGNTYNINRQGMAADISRVTSDEFTNDVLANQERTTAMGTVQALAPQVEAMRSQVQQAIQRDQRVNNGQISNGTRTRMAQLERLEMQYQQALRVSGQALR